MLLVNLPQSSEDKPSHLPKYNCAFCIIFKIYN